MASINSVIDMCTALLSKSPKAVPFIKGKPGMGKSEATHQIGAALGIDEFSGRRIAKLSTGMKQKVSIVRTMIHDPSVLILDEATAGLDVIAARSIIELVRRARDEGKTVIFSTHRMDEVSLLADDLAIIHRGSMLYSGAYERFREEMTSASLEDEFIHRIEQASRAGVSA